MRRFFVIFAFSLVALAGCSSTGNRAANPSSGGPQTTSPATPVAAADLIEAYRANESKADKEYKGKALAVTGIVSRKGTDYTNKPYVDLKADNPIIEVHCNYEDAGDASMAALKEGQQVTIRGVCAGRLSTFVILKDSTLQQ